jgi:hypothetical protein
LTLFEEESATPSRWLRTWPGTGGQWGRGDMPRHAPHGLSHPLTMATPDCGLHRPGGPLSLLTELSEPVKGLFGSLGQWGIGPFFCCAFETSHGPYLLCCSVVREEFCFLADRQCPACLVT